MEAEFSLPAGTQPFPSEAGLDPTPCSQAGFSLPSFLDETLKQLRFLENKGPEGTKACKELLGRQGRAEVAFLLKTSREKTEENTGRYLHALSANSMHT